MGTLTPPSPILGNPTVLADARGPVRWWRFDEQLGNVVDDVIEGVDGAILGHKSLWKSGVSGTALGFDGYFSEVRVAGADAPTLDDELTVDAWVALGAFPFAEAPLVEHTSGDDGYALGIDERGRPRFRVGDAVVTAPRGLTLYRWAHLVGAYGEGSLELYVDGEPVASTLATAPIVTPATPLVMGLNTDPVLPTGPVRPSHTYPSRLGLEGLVDEVRLYDYKLSEPDVRAVHDAFDPGVRVTGSPDLQARVLPGQPGVADRFGAIHERLTYHDLWDNQWRASRVEDVVVKFDDLPTSYVYWRGTSHGVNMVTERNHWMSDQSVEIFCGDRAPPGPEDPSLGEHMSDKEARFTHVRVLENTDARVVVHWRYTTADLFFEMCTGNDFVDEYHTIYPDGTLVRTATYWEETEGEDGVSSDFQMLSSPGFAPRDIVNEQAASIVDEFGEVIELTWTGDDGVPVGEGPLLMANVRSEYKPFQVFELGGTGPWGAEEQSPFTSDAFAGPWNHWPISRVVTDGRFAIEGDGRVNHFALAAGGGRSVLYGFSNQRSTTSQDIRDIVPLADAWRSAPEPVNVVGATSEGYDSGQRDYDFVLTEAGVSFELEGSDETPIHHPCFVLRRWSGGPRASLLVDGTVLESARSGTFLDTDGTPTMVVFAPFSTTRPAAFEVVDVDP
ncbi:MAG: LamG domain-containing protein [Myxococcota bacterium]